MWRSTLLAAAISALLGVLTLRAQSEATNEHMPFITDSNSCLECHDASPVGTAAGVKEACSQLCASCHEDMDRHHKVPARLPDDAAPDLNLTSRHEVGCVTCHDLTIERYDSTPWRAESLFGRYFRKSDRYKTYYLVRKNDKGQLCRTCH